jgi:cobaltochelatase CobS
MKVRCEVCGYSAHDLRPHFVGGRLESCSVSLKEYQAKFASPVTSKLFDAKLVELRKKAEKSDAELTSTLFDTMALFGLTFGKDNLFPGFIERTEHVPDIDPRYLFPEYETRALLMGLMENKPTMVHGPTGTGKTMLVLQVAARLNYPVLRIQHHSDMYAFAIEGQMRVANGETSFQEGPLPFAMQQAMILVLDEWDAIQPEIAFLYQSVMERKNGGSNLGSLTLTSDNNRVVRSHPQFRIVATSNTTGMGDSKGHYQGTQLQNFAFISRFLCRIYLGYMTKEQETKILQDNYPILKKKEAEGFAKTAKLIRDQYEAGELNAPFSTRDLTNWVEWYIKTASPDKAMKVAYSSIFPFADGKKIEEIVQRIFG